jgi:peptide/nickel transport system permease protein
MRNYLIKRILLAIPTVIGVTVLIFFVMRILPGDPLTLIYGENTGIYILSDEELAHARHSLGLDKPLYEQYFSWIGDIATGELGKSFWRDEPIREVITRRGPITAQIAIMAIALSWIIGLPAGVFAATRRNTKPDLVTRTLMTFFQAIPSFWLGTSFVLIAVIFFTWRPPIQMAYLWTDPMANLQMTLGPAIAMGLGIAASIGRMSRTTLLEVIREDYVRTARAKGLSEKVVLARHVVKNALLPVITVSGLQLATLLGGSVAVEQAFAVPGLGTALVQAITERDWMVIQNLVLLYGLTFVVINLLIDLSYAWIDPRIRYE